MSVTLEPVRGSGAGNLDFGGSGTLRMNDGVLANLRREETTGGIVDV